MNRGLGSLVQWDWTVGFALRIRIGVHERLLKSFAFFFGMDSTGVSFLRWSSEYCMIGAAGVELKEFETS